jgi:hypothetical protein
MSGVRQCVQRRENDGERERERWREGDSPSVTCLLRLPLARVTKLPPFFMNMSTYESWRSIASPSAMEPRKPSIARTIHDTGFGGGRRSVCVYHPASGSGAERTRGVTFRRLGGACVDAAR